MRRSKRWAFALALSAAAVLVGCDDLHREASPTPVEQVGVQRVDAEDARFAISPGHLEKGVERTAIRSCRRPLGLEIDRRGRLLVACALLGEIQVIDPTSRSVLETWGPFYDKLFRLDVVPGDARLIAVGMAGSIAHILNLHTGRPIERVNVGRNIADMKRLGDTSEYLIVSSQEKQITVLDASTASIERVLRFPEPVGYVAVAQNSELAAVTGGVYKRTGKGVEMVSGHVYFFNPRQETSIVVGQTLAPGKMSREPVFVRDDQWLLVPNHTEGTVSVFDVATRQLYRTLDVKAGPERLIIGPEGRRVYSLNTRSASVSVIELAPLTVLRDIPLPSPPENGVVSPDGRYLVLTLPDVPTEKQPVISKPGAPVTEEELALLSEEVGEIGNYIALVDLHDLTLADLIPASADPAAITQSADGRRVYVANFKANTVSIFQ
ncbi:hypothetical protein KDL45_12810 [bacterium]|nr:hypothetical protein [bacterium]